MFNDRPRLVATPASRQTQTRELVVCCLVAVLLVLFRCFVPAIYEQLDFDSDQAIIGLMAKHVSEFRAFPVFMYGQGYILAVESWIAAPFFWVGGPTFTMLRTPLVLMNSAVAVWLITILSRDGGLRPVLAFTAVLPFMATTPVTSSNLLQNTGANIEPFVYILALWMVRQRAEWFGGILAVGALNREFTLFAVPAILFVQVLDRPALGWKNGWTVFVRAATSFAVVWIAVMLAADFFTPDARMADTGRWLAGPAASLFQRFSPGPGQSLARLQSVLSDGLPDLFGWRVGLPARHNIATSIQTGSHLVAAAALVLLGVCFVRLTPRGWPRRRQEATRAPLVALYLGLVGLQAVVAYAFARDIDVTAAPVLRYLLLALLVPVALLAAFFRREPRPLLRNAVVVLTLVWAATNLADNGRLLAEYQSSPPPSLHQRLADDLVTRHVRFGWATYWDCYRVDFLAREQVILASTDFIRIPSYQRQVEQERPRAVDIVRQPCTVGRRFEAWCIVEP